MIFSRKSSISFSLTGQTAGKWQLLQPIKITNENGTDHCANKNGIRISSRYRATRLPINYNCQWRF